MNNKMTKTSLNNKNKSMYKKRKTNFNNLALMIEINNVYCYLY